MKRLREMGIVDSVDEGMKVSYNINEENVATIEWCLDAIPTRKI